MVHTSQSRAWACCEESPGDQAGSCSSPARGHHPPQCMWLTLSGVRKESSQAQRHNCTDIRHRQWGWGSPIMGWGWEGIPQDLLRMSFPEPGAGCRVNPECQASGLSMCTLVFLQLVLLKRHWTGNPGWEASWPWRFHGAWERTCVTHWRDSGSRLSPSWRQPWTLPLLAVVWGWRGCLTSWDWWSVSWPVWGSPAPACSGAAPAYENHEAGAKRCH